MPPPKDMEKLKVTAETLTADTSPVTAVELSLTVQVGVLVKFCPKLTEHDVTVPPPTVTVNTLFVAAPDAPGPAMLGLGVLPQVPIVGAVPPKRGIPFMEGN